MLKQSKWGLFAGSLARNCLRKFVQVYPSRLYPCFAQLTHTSEKTSIETLLALKNNLTACYSIKKKKERDLPVRGIEPRSRRWERRVLTITPYRTCWENTVWLTHEIAFQKEGSAYRRGFLIHIKKMKKIRKMLSKKFEVSEPSHSFP